MDSWRDRVSSWTPRVLVAVHDLTMVWICWQVLHRIRYAMLAHGPEFPLWSNEIAIVLVAQGVVFWWMGLYRGLWRFASLPDLWNIVKACALGQASSSVMARHVIGATVSEIRQAREDMLAMLKADGEGPAGRFEDMRFLKPVKDYKARHASTMLTFDAVVDAIGQIEAKRLVKAG